MTHVIVATWKAMPGKAEEIEQILIELARETRTEPGALFLNYLLMNQKRQKCRGADRAYYINNELWT